MKQTYNKKYPHTESQNTPNIRKKTITHGILITKVWQEKMILLSKLFPYIVHKVTALSTSKKEVKNGGIGN
jgi:hypothetical protein